MNSVDDDGNGDDDDEMRVMWFVSGRRNERFEKGMCVVSNLNFESFRRVIGELCVVVGWLIDVLKSGDVGGGIGENNFFDRMEESLNDERRLSLRGLEDDIPWLNDEALSKVILFDWMSLNKLSLVFLFEIDDEDEIVDFVWKNSSSSSHRWLNKSDRTGNTRWHRLHVRNCSIPLLRLPI